MASIIHTATLEGYLSVILPFCGATNKVLYPFMKQNTMKPLAVFVSLFMLSLCVPVHSEIEVKTLFLERGYRGIVPCNPAASLVYTFDDLEGVYWYLGQYDRDHFIFSYFHGALYQGDGIPERMYDISSHFGLIIQNVTDSDEGTYYYKVEPLEGLMYTGSVEVAVKVTANQPFPIVPECDLRPPDLVDTCIVFVPCEARSINLTCKVEQVKPPVDITWFSVFQDGHTEPADPSTAIRPVYQPGSLFTSFSFLQLETTNDDIVMHRCEARGVALGSKNESHFSVTARKVSAMVPKVQDRTVYLERGHRGIVPCFPDGYTLGDLKVIFFYFGSRDKDHAIISYFNRTVTPLNGIPERVYDVNSNLALVIQNVTDSDEGIYFYLAVPEVGKLYQGSLRVAVKVSTSQPFPVVPECELLRSELADTCTVTIPLHTAPPSLTCTVQHVKPPVDIQWFRLFKNSHTEREVMRTTKQLISNSHSYLARSYTTTSSINLPPMVDNGTRYRCVAYGVALGDNNGSHVTVTVMQDVLPRHQGTDVRTKRSDTHPQNNLNTAMILLMGLFIFISIFPVCIALEWRICHRNHQKARHVRKGASLLKQTSDDKIPEGTHEDEGL